MNWRLAAIPATLIPILIIAIQFDIKIEDVLAIGLLPFVGAIVAMFVKLGLQGVKFAYITRNYLGSFDSFFYSLLVQIIYHNKFCANKHRSCKFDKFTANSYSN